MEKHYCPDCQRELNIEIQQWKHKPATATYTCKTHGCELQWVTLSWDVWEAKLADGSIEEYREMNRKNANP